MGGKKKNWSIRNYFNNHAYDYKLARKFRVPEKKNTFLNALNGSLMENYLKVHTSHSEKLER